MGGQSRKYKNPRFFSLAHADCSFSKAHLFITWFAVFTEGSNAPYTGYRRKRWGEQTLKRLVSDGLSPTLFLSLLIRYVCTAGIRHFMRLFKEQIKSQLKDEPRKR